MIQKRLLASDFSMSLGNKASHCVMLFHLCNAGIVKLGEYPIKLKYDRHCAECSINSVHSVQFLLILRNCKKGLLLFMVWGWQEEKFK